ncbi:MAG: SUMF1/EgtB/PvdO family nonheme iron enzyme [Anaerolineales bacterium]|nr:SUMF1/EgtB/PvdO family nonheme iron enzyme [Anaerolineales bacterium]
MTLTTGQTLNNRYRIVKLLGQGGFGAVYRAWDTNLDGPVALKENFETSPAAVKQFQLEAKLLFTLRHPGLPKVSDSFSLPGQGQYLVMEYIEGEDLQEMLSQAGGPLHEAQALAWIEQVCQALEYMHSQDPPVIHRDIKPANIKITPAGKAVLVDFGIAKLYDPFATTAIGAKAISPGYSAPEQYGGERTDARSDIYALGATLYHLLTGKRPPESVKIASGTATLKSPRSLNEKISPAIEAIIFKCMEIDVKQRYKGIRELREALSGSAFYVESVPERKITRARSAARTVSNIRAAGSKYRAIWGWIAAGVLALTLCVVAVSALVAWIGGGEDRKATETALALERTRTAEALMVTEALKTTAAMPTTQVPATTAAPPTDTPTPAPPTATFTPTGLPLTYTDEKGVPMALIPAGEFWMGSEDDTHSKPVHTVYLDAFYMDIYEVTNALYEQCVQAGVCTPPRYSQSSTRDSYYGNSAYADYPVIYVEWEQARAFCEEWRGARLPTEAEWEKAARGGLEGKLYPWGDEAPVCQKGAQNGANFSSCTSDDTEPVGSYSANSYGLYDMAGNVWEWVQDWYDQTYYSISPSSNPRGPISGATRVLRGGSWYNIPYNLRAANRFFNNPVSRLIYIFGFRCAGSVASIEELTPKATQMAPTSTATPETSGELPNSYTDERGVPMALVPAGEFQMGSEDGADDQKPVHTVYLDAFYMDIYEVTNALYEKCVQAGVCTPPSDSSSYTRSKYYGSAEYADYPVIYVNWEQAITFCEEWRGARLPTEAEWEKAARGRLEGRLYPWSDNAPDCSILNFDASGCIGNTSKVGSYSPNGYGLFDMAGNVWEWVWDWYGLYSSLSSSNPQGPSSGQHRILRGGAWNSYGYYLHTAYRYRLTPGGTDFNYGFRCSRSP